MESPLDVLSRAASMVNQSDRLEVGGRVNGTTSRGSIAKHHERLAAVRSENKRHFSDHPATPAVTSDPAAIMPAASCFTADRCRDSAAAAAAAAVTVGQWQNRHLLSMRADLGDLQGPAGLPPYPTPYRGDSPALGWMALFDKRIALPSSGVPGKVESVSQPPSLRAAEYGLGQMIVVDQEPLNLSRKSSVTADGSSSSSGRGQLSNASVFTSVSAMAVSDKNISSKSWRDAAESCDPAIEEHFRRSLGGSYTAPLSPVAVQAHISDAVDDHFAKSLGATWQRMNAPADEDAKSSKGGPGRGVRGAAKPALTVDDHFSKALGDKWLELQKAGEMQSLTSVMPEPVSASSAKRQKLSAAKTCS